MKGRMGEGGFASVIYLFLRNSQSWERGYYAVRC
jgi:hypothetical protein